MSSVTIHVDGLRELERKLLALPDKVNRKVLRKSVSDGAAVVRDEVRIRAPYYTGPISAGHPPAGTLKKAVFMSHARTSHQGYEAFVVGVRHGKRVKATLDAYYFFWVEFGSGKSYNKGPQPYIRNSFDTKKEAALQAIKTSLWDGVSAVARE